MRRVLIIVLSVVAGAAAITTAATATLYLGGDQAATRWAGAVVALALAGAPVVTLLERANRRAAAEVGGTRVPTGPVDRDVSRTLDDLRLHH